MSVAACNYSSNQYKAFKTDKLRQHQYARELGQTNNNIEEAFAGVEVIKSYNLQKCMMNRYEKHFTNICDI